MNQGSDPTQSLIDENTSLKALITVLVAHCVILEEEHSKVLKENEKIILEYEEYRVRHPIRVGVKHGKAYELKELRDDEKSGAADIDQYSKSPKKIGAQQGHKRQVREKCENFDREIDADVNQCPHCGSSNLSGIQEERVRFIDDILPQSPITTRYSIKRRYCPYCKKIVEGVVTDALPHARIGLNTMLIVVWMKVGLRLTVSAIPQVLKKMCGLILSEGEVSNICDLIAEALGPYYEELLEEVRNAEARYMDETSWIEQGDRIWMWTFVAKGVTLYKIAHSRGHEVPLEVLGSNPSGVDIHDRFGAYNVLAQKTGNRPQQLCWFHLLGDTKELAQFCGEEGKQIHTSMKAIFLKAKCFDHMAKVADVEQLINEINLALNREFTSMKCKKFARKILKQSDKLFTFTTNPEVEGTNNRAERAVRPYVVLRKISGGTKSPRGTRNIEVLASAIQTCKLNGSDLVEKGRDLIMTSSH